MHQRQCVAHFNALVAYVLNTELPVFDSVWPKLARELMTHASHVPFNAKYDLNSGAVPALVANYFGGRDHEIQRRELLLRCLVAEYLKGILGSHNHAQSHSLPGLRKNVRDAARVIDSLKRIDFADVFEQGAPAMYRDLDGLPAIKAKVEDYLGALMADRVDLLARRSDALDMPEAFVIE